MKRTLVFMFLLITGAAAFGQSKSFSSLSEAFSNNDNVTSFSLGGLGLKWSSGEDEDKALSGIRDVRFLHIPRGQFEAGDVKLSSLKRSLSRDNFEVMFNARDGKDNVSVYLQENRGENNNLYFLLVEDDDNITAIEIKGYIDPKTLRDSKSRSKITGI